MAIGLAWIFGFKLPLNFIAPIRAASSKELWQRWHLTLTNFFRDYFYIPLNKKREIHGVMRRPGKLWQTMSLLALFLISGLWHGANWSFVIWGGLHGLMFVVHNYWHHATHALHHIKKQTFYRVFTLMVFLLFSMTVIVFFRAPSTEIAIQILNPKFYDTWPDIFMAAEQYLRSTQMNFMFNTGIEPLWMLSALVIVSYLLCYILPTHEEMFQKIMRFPELENHRKSLLHFSWCGNVPFLILGIVIFIISLFFISENNPFIYFQF
jgi:D-alanyl-lipoteichoic acid acyltransferase DltB (MBOAT superfamily)